MLNITIKYVLFRENAEVKAGGAQPKTYNRGASQLKECPYLTPPPPIFRN